MKPCNGHRSWNAWNVALWIGNDEGLYNLALECLRFYKNDLDLAACMFVEAVGLGSKTPDGAQYSHLAVKLALDGYVEETSSAGNDVTG